MSFSDPNPYASPSISAEARLPVDPIQGTIDYPLASRWMRLCASLIDAIVYWALAFPVLIGIDFLLFLWTSKQGFWGGPTGQQIINNIFAGTVLFLCVHGYLLAMRGQTVGKRLLRMQIVSNEGRLVPLWRLIAIRYLPIWLVTIIPGIGLLMLVANALAIFRESRKCFHDDIAGTKVIQL